MGKPVSCQANLESSQSVENGGGDAIAFDYVVDRADRVRLVQVDANWEAVPVTSENLTIDIISDRGAVHNYNLLNLDPSTDYDGVFDYHLQPDPAVYITKGDTVRVAYANTDDQDVCVTLIFAKVD